MNEFTQSYLLSASHYAKSFELEKHSADRTQILLLKSLVAALSAQRSSDSPLERLGIDLDIFRQILTKLVERALGDFSLEANGSPKASLTDEKLRFLSVVIDAAQATGNDAPLQMNIELSGDALTRLERAGDIILSRDTAIGWKLRSFLMKQSADRYTNESFSAILDEGGEHVEEELIYGFVDAYVQGKSQSIRDQLLDELIDHDRLIRGSIGPLLAARRLLGHYQGRFITNQRRRIATSNINVQIDQLVHKGVWTSPKCTHTSLLIYASPNPSLTLSTYQKRCYSSWISMPTK